MGRTPIVQFGTSRFLQAHADLFFTEAEPARRVSVVQSSGDPARARRLGALSAPGGFPVRIRGLADGREVDEERRVTSVVRTLSTATDWDRLTTIVVREAEVILSNTADAGYEPQPGDLDRAPHQAMSFPAKLFHLLKARHAAGGGQVLVMPTELVPENGRVLKARVMEIAGATGADDGLFAYLEALPFANSLVDRIVSEPIEPAGAVAEPYALWAIEKAAGVVAPCNHPAVRLVDDLGAIERLKLWILNLGHTVLADMWLAAGGDEAVTVREMMVGEAGGALREIYAQEVLPGFAAHGEGEVAARYRDTTLERLQNPFLDHRLADIAQNHRQKVERRVAAFLAFAGTPAPRLAAVVARARG
ncbi:mannitol dehydrogenase family protein [Acuticoccus sp. 2012]|uniref:Mannitol dehydrogenase family protein n=1 Tax=Acuticoccus mangrovi TaxID=2796142 RepID=A0A934MEW9_9HYPH|nr:mannitol dehydrogenase family protein [Acuticoccus mangrovi]